MRIASLNALSDIDDRPERLTQIFVEASGLGVDVLALQEVPNEVHGTIRDLANAHGYAWQHTMTGVPGDEVATFSRLPIDDSGSFTVIHPPPISSRRFAWVQVQGFLIANVHLTWGAHNEAARLREVSAIEIFVADAVTAHAGAATTDQQPQAARPELVSVLVGDFNAEPDNDCIRFLRGKTTINGASTYWTEATLGTDLQHTPTTRETNQWGQQSARSRGVDASLLYPRRIDFIFTRGWRHGGRGTMRNTRLFGTSVTPGGSELSDHYGWVTDLER